MSKGKKQPGPAPDRGGPRVLVYDGDCPLCLRTAALAARLGGGEVRAFQELDRPRREQLLEAGVREELVVVDEATASPRTGVDGLLWWAEDNRLAGPARLARPFRPVLAPLYRFVAVNRRFLAPPAEPRATCACEPEPDRAWNLAFLLVAAASCLALAAWFGADLTASTLGSVRYETVAGAMLAVAIFGFSFAMLPDPRIGRLRSAAHAAGALLAGSWVLGVAALAGLAGTRPWGLLAVVAAVWLTARSWGRRTDHLYEGE